MIIGIEEYRRAIERAVRRARRGNAFPSPAIDMDVSFFGEVFGTSVEGVPSDEHRRLAMEARAEFWKHHREGEIADEDAVQCFEEMSHTE